jgi:hypothetical protein
MTPDEPEEDVTVPLVIYIGGERRVLGHAVVTSEEVQCFLDESRSAELLEEIREGIREGWLKNLSVQINPPPATPVVRDGHVTWVTDYRKGPTDNGR